MSNQATERRCQQRGCLERASRHAIIYKLQPVGVLESNEQSVNLDFRGLHADLCELHLSEQRNGGAVIEEMELDQCGETCPNFRARRSGSDMPDAA